MRLRTEDTGIFQRCLSDVSIKKNRTADIPAHALVELYEEEQRNTLSKMGRISHEVEQVARMVKVLWSDSDKQLHWKNLWKFLTL
jgi:hypothetical protein